MLIAGKVAEVQEWTGISYRRINELHVAPKHVAIAKQRELKIRWTLKSMTSLHQFYHIFWLELPQYFDDTEKTD